MNTGVCGEKNRWKQAGGGGTRAPQIGQRLRLLADVTGRRQSFFLQQIIESGIAAIEATWLPPDVLSQVRRGLMPPRQEASPVISDLFDGP
jgi:RHH-type rel operon transcriptional repressor/antitoxin RelB